MYFKRLAEGISTIPLNELKAMNAEKLLKKFRLIHYSPEDIKEINLCITKINNIMKKNTLRLEESQNGNTR